MAKSYESRISRLLKIITLIRGQSGWNAEKLAEECKTSVRNIYRDMTMLEGAGIPYFFDKESGSYSIRKDFFMPAVELTLEESLALVELTEQVADKGQVPFMKPAARAVAKIRSQLPSKIRDALEKQTEQVELHLARAATGEGISDVYEEVRLAIMGQYALRCRYESVMKKAGRNGDEEFIFKPYKLYFSQRAWYAIGQHEGRKEIRSLRLNRFSSIKPTKEPYAIPPDFSMKKHLGNAWRMIRGKPYQVELLFDTDFADTIADTHWHATQDTESTPDDGLIFRCKVDGLSEIVWWVLSMGHHCQVIKPPELAEMVKKEARALLGVYGIEPVAEKPGDRATIATPTPKSEIKRGKAK